MNPGRNFSAGLRRRSHEGIDRSPAHDENRVIVATIENAKKLAYPDFEILAVNNATNDKTVSIARAPSSPPLRRGRSHREGEGAVLAGEREIRAGGSRGRFFLPNPHAAAIFIRQDKLMDGNKDVGPVDPRIEAIWREVLTHGHRHNFAFLPGQPRCVTCSIPFKGIGGRILALTSGLRQSRKNPSICNLCDDTLPAGGAEVDVAVLFADVRGSTGLAERVGPTDFAGMLNRFYRAASEVLLSHHALIDKMVGDEVVAIFFPSNSPSYRADAVRAAAQILESVGFSATSSGWLPVGVGVHAGMAFCGRIGSGGVHDFTALGDTVNIGSRLQAQAKAGEVIMSEEIYREVANDFKDLESRTLEIRGREASLGVRVLRVGPPSTAGSR